MLRTQVTQVTRFFYVQTFARAHGNHWVDLSPSSPSSPAPCDSNVLESMTICCQGVTAPSTAAESAPCTGFCLECAESQNPAERTATHGHEPQRGRAKGVYGATPHVRRGHLGKSDRPESQSDHLAIARIRLVEASNGPR